MRAFLYYATHSLLNTIKKLMKTWVAIIVVMIICFGLIGGITAVVDNIQSGKEQDTSVTEVDDGDVVVSDENGDVVAEFEVDRGTFKEFFKKYNISKEVIVDFAISALFLLILATNVYNSKSSGKIFMPADVPMLFASPMRPQTVLMFRLLSSLGTSLFFSLFMLYQIPNLMYNAKLGLWGAVSCVIVYMLSLVISTLIQVAFYTIASKVKNGTENINKVLIGAYGLIGLGFVAYVTIGKKELIPGLVGYFANPKTHWVPFWGWLRGISYYAVTGDIKLSLLYLGLFVVACILIIIFIWKVKADFYEDAMFAAEKKAEQIENARRSTNGATVVRSKERKGSLDREGFHYGSGANVFFYKAVFNRFRFAKFKIFSTTMIVYTLVAGIAAYLSRVYLTTGDGFIVPAAALGIMVFYRTLGDPIREDTSREFFALIPAKDYSKIIYSLLGCLTVTAIDLLLPMVLSGVILGTNPVTIIAWFLFILSISFFATTVGTFIALSIPGESAKTLKTIIQMIFLYMGLGPSAVAVILGMIFHQLTLTLFIGCVINAAIGFLVSLLLPLFLRRK